jgi:hypothetical protein
VLLIIFIYGRLLWWRGPKGTPRREALTPAEEAGVAVIPPG